ncbi:hypothetical protein N7520_010197 [Penicillium odoratum]|uniref:uncharacterized protein n=1 Tax=Penicillium odoratum TaxID=1167516 RepID=UPI002546DA61|nr:uncharacterized protein N7520_010197 [Penicillium odoratum]KAJ5753280.1 hypothetical protein N7520_010197 [Penicillium odoratum]
MDLEDLKVKNNPARLANDLPEFTCGERRVEKIQLNGLYTQAEGRRQMTKLETISASWVICDSWAGIAGTISLAVAQGGPATLIYGTFLIFFWLVPVLYASRTDLFIRLPADNTTGPLSLAPKSMNRALTYCCGMATVFSWIAICTGIAIIPAQLIVGIALFYNPDYVPSAWHYFLIY